MSCGSGRAFHNICIPGCPTVQSCCTSRTAFSCQELCPCPALEDNLLFTPEQVRAEFCNYIALLGCTGVSQGVPFGGTTTYNLCLGTTGWPAFSCPVEIGVVPDGFSGPFQLVATITNGVSVPVSPSVIPDGGTYNVAINEMPCDPPIDVFFTGA